MATVATPIEAQRAQTKTSARTHHPLVPLWILLALGGLLFLFAAEVMVTSPGSRKGADSQSFFVSTVLSNSTVLPVLTAMRDEKGVYFVANRVQHTWSYKAMHVVPAMIWVLLIPLQNIPKIRRNYSKLHRVAGRMAFGVSVPIAVSGFYFPHVGLSYSHPNYFHIHKLRLGGSPGIVVLVWPTFSLASTGYGVVFVISLYKAWATAIAMRRDRKTFLPKHQYWATLFTYIGYLVPFQRVWILSYHLFGFIAHRFFSQPLKHWLNFPTEESGFHEAELAAFAWATAMDLPVFLYLVYKLPVQPSMRSVTAAKVL